MLTDGDPHVGWMKFEARIIPYSGDDGWVDEALHRALEVARLNECPQHAHGCDAGRWLEQASNANRAFPGNRAA